MRLNKNSMDKLFDLMIMSFKHQILFSNSPQQYLQITLNHLESLRYMMIHYSSTPDTITGPFKSQISSPKIQKGSIVIPLINNIISRIIGLYGNFSSLQWLSLKQSLYLFFQGKRIKISLFLQQNIQNLDGNFLFENNPKLPYGTEKPGIVRSYDSNNSIITNKFISEIGIDSIESHEILDKSSSLGFNMFDNSCKPPPIIFESSTELESALMTYIETKKSDKSDSNKVSSSSSRSLSTAKGIIFLSFLLTIIIISYLNLLLAEIHGLADVLGLGIRSVTSSSKDTKDSFKINLFPSNTFDSKGGSKGIDDIDDYEDNDAGFIHIDIDATADYKTIDKYMKDLDLDDDNDHKADGKYDDDDDDLLDLMDSIK